MKLPDALRASNSRKAKTVIHLSSKVRALVAADDAGVTVVYNGGRGIDIQSWVEISPEDRKLLHQANWEPVDPKHPLVQLAEALTDWEDE